LYLRSVTGISGLSRQDDIHVKPYERPALLDAAELAPRRPFRIGIPRDDRIGRRPTVR